MRQVTLGNSYYIVKNDDFAVLNNFGFTQCKQTIFPTQLVRKVNETMQLRVCDEKERSYNVWTGEDWKSVGIIYLCEKLDGRKYGTRNSEKIEPYIQDLIDKDIVELA